jgi:para-nitrobenzyl esterase
LRNFLRSTVACITLLVAQAALCAPPQVAIDGGRLEGVLAGKVFSFKGIPYAAAPLGENRWRAPQPVAPWSEPLKADHYGALCKQIVNTKDNGVGPPPDSEDCLTLNVFSPGISARRRLPVMFWIHGGGYVNGSGTASLYDGSELAKQGVVVVTINYRLGRFGFFAHPALAAAAPHEARGNYGIMDMIAGLQWVKRNIAQFGGDPRNVTIFGESAGAGAVCILMASPPAAGLFSKAIAQSAPARMELAYLHRATPTGIPSAEDLGVEFAQKLGMQNPTAAELRALPADKIVAAGDPDLLRGGGPIIDGTIVPDRTDRLFIRGAQAHVPFILGTNALEFPVTPAMPTPFAKLVTIMPAAQKTAVIAGYGSEEAFNRNAISDIIFGEPTVAVAEAHTKAGLPTYLYRFSVLSAGAPKMISAAPHASDRQYVFKTLNASPWPTDKMDEQQAKLVSAYWVAFAKTGNPNGAGRPKWPTFSPAQPQWFDFKNDGPKIEDVANKAAYDAIAKEYAGTQ